MFSTARLFVTCPVGIQYDRSEAVQLVHRTLWSVFGIIGFELGIGLGLSPNVDPLGITNSLYCMSLEATRLLPMGSTGQSLIPSLMTIVRYFIWLRS